MQEQVRIRLFSIGSTGYQSVPGGSFLLEKVGSVPRVGDRIIKPQDTSDRSPIQQTVYEVVHCYFAPAVHGGAEPQVLLVVDERPGVDGELELFRNAPP
jgi:hypothetical protein